MNTSNNAIYINSSNLKLLGESVLTKQTAISLLPASMSGIVTWYYDLGTVWGIRADLALCQMLHETDYLTSWWSLEPRRNPAGLGVTGQTAKHLIWFLRGKNWQYNPNNKQWEYGLSFPGWGIAVQTHYAHLSAYVYIKETNAASKIDPRYQLVRQEFIRNKWPLCHTLNDLDNKWAVPGVTYGDAIANVYNNLLLRSKSL